jgi:hypothetical protein
VIPYFRRLLVLNKLLGVMAPEENLCRRSNLYATLVDPKGHHASNYPIPPKGGIYSEHVGKSGKYPAFLKRWYASCQIVYIQIML